MPLVKLKFRPGVDKEVTDYENTLGWFDTDKVRFRAGYPENIGGWTPYSSDSFIGICRTLLPWTSLDSSEYVAVPTSSKLYVEKGSSYEDITPIRASSTINTNPFNITEASAVVTVTDTGHGAITGAYVTFSGATSGDDTLQKEEGVLPLLIRSTPVLIQRLLAQVGVLTRLAGKGGAVLLPQLLMLRLNFGYGAWLLLVKI